MSMAILGMTKDQARAALHVTDSILEQCCCCSIHKATGEGKLLPYEKDLIEVLLVEWGTASKKATDLAVKQIMANHGEFSLEEAESLVSAIGAELSGTLVAGVSKKMPPLIKSSYWLAKSTAKAKFDIVATWGDIDKVSVKWLTNHHLYWVGTYFEKNLSDKLMAEVAAGMQEGLGRQAIGNRLADFFNDYPGVGSKPDTYWRGLAANGMNRSQNFGVLRSYEELEIRYLEFVAVIDARTSPICLQRNGAIIPLSAATSQRDRLMAAENPEDVKAIAPWAGADSLEGKSNSEILGMGVIMPPLHFNCRSTVVEHIEQGKSL